MEKAMNGGTFLAFLLTAIMIVVVVIHQEPATLTPSVPVAAKAPVAVPAEAGSVALRTSESAKPHGQPALAPTLPSAPPVALGSAAPTSKTAEGHILKTHGVGCAVAGTAGTGLAIAVGPADVAAVIAGALLIPVSPLVIGAALGTVFVTGCAVGVAVSPVLAN